jgi:5-bromo-4-chloroindolyl phosphate hydrolysis protein
LNAKRKTPKFQKKNLRQTQNAKKWLKITPKTPNAKRQTPKMNLFRNSNFYKFYSKIQNLINFIQKFKFS